MHIVLGTEDAQSPTPAVWPRAAAGQRRRPAPSQAAQGRGSLVSDPGASLTPCHRCELQAELRAAWVTCASTQGEPFCMCTGFDPGCLWV